MCQNRVVLLPVFVESILEHVSLLRQHKNTSLEIVLSTIVGDIWKYTPLIESSFAIIRAVVDLSICAI